MALLVAITGAGAVLGSAVITRHRAQAAADLAAMAAAGQLGSGSDSACLMASTVAAAMRATVSVCDVDGLDVVVTVDIPVEFGRWGIDVAHAVARAGPGVGS